MAAALAGLLLVLPVAASGQADGAAQPAPSRDAFVGIYDGRQMELAAALQLGDDGRFEYYLSYGALDEMAAGKWTVEGGAVVLDSDSVTAPAFELVESGKGRGGQFEIALDVPQGLPVQLFSAAVIFADGTGQVGDFRQDRLRFAIARGQTVTALHLGFPAFGVESGPIEVPAGVREMHFRFAPNDLGKVAFDHQVLPVEQGALLLERHDRTIRFRRQADEAR